MANFGDGADRAGAPVGGVPVAGAEFLGGFFEFGLSGKLRRLKGPGREFAVLKERDGRIDAAHVEGFTAVRFSAGTDDEFR